MLPEASGLEFSIVMPCLDEAETLGGCLAKAFDFLERSGIAGEVIVADNGSTDGSQAIALALGARLVEVPVRGYGAALQAGIAAAAGRYVIMGDADGSYDFSDLGGFVASLRAGHELVMGNRFSGSIELGAMPLLHRYLGNPVLSFLGRLFFKARIGDFHCGLRGFSREAILALDLRTTGMEFASEMVVRSALAGLRIAEIPTRLAKDGRSRSPHLRTWRDGWRHLRFLLLYSPRWLFFYPGAALVLLGLAGALPLLAGPVAIGKDVVLDVHTMLVACTCCLVGVQSVCFALIAREYATARKLIPPSPRYKTLLSQLTLERMLALGGIVFAGGLIGLGCAFEVWREAAFGDLAHFRVLRLVIISVTGLAIGAQLMLSGFFAGLIAIAQRD
jgi:hypothetical protein